jgi:putative transposase
VKFQWIQDHLDEFEVAMMCRMLDVSRSGYYAWGDRPPSDRAKQQQQLIDEIRTEHQLSRGSSGAPKITKALAERGIQTCLNTVASLMKKASIRSVRCGRFVPQTTDSNHDHRVADNLVNQDFNATAVNQKWLTDITYVDTDEGFVYLASVMDVFSRKIVGWCIADHLRAELCLQALENALRSRKPKSSPDSELIHHSDRGVQYACDAYQLMLSDHGIVCSMSRAGNCYDNAMMESFHATYKLELVYQQPGKRFRTKEQATQMTFEWIECFYNRVRRHSSIDYRSPEQFEAVQN